MIVKTKRYIILLIALLIGFSFTGCEKKGVQRPLHSNKEVKHLEMWKFKSNKEDYIIYDWINQWNNTHPEVQVSIKLIPFNEYLSTKLPTAFATNSAPDIYMISAGSFLKYADAGCMLPLDEYISDSVKEDFYISSLETVYYKGSIMGIPIEREPVALFYNKNVFLEQNISPPRYWNELIDVLKQLHSENMAGIHIPLQSNDYQNFIFYSFLLQLGDGAIDKKTNSADFLEGGSKALQFWRDLSKYNYKTQTLVQSPSDINPLATGKAAMQICGYWAVNMLEKYYPDFEYGVIPLPYPKGGKDRSVYGGWYQIVNPNSKHKKEAVDFTLWMWGQDISRTKQWYTEASTKFPARKSVFNETSEIFNTGNNKIFANDILPKSIPEPRYHVEVAKAVSKAIQDAMFTDKDIKIIAEMLDKEINNYLKSASIQ